jgi:hypothetical protein
VLAAGCGGSKKSASSESERKRATAGVSNDHVSKQVSGKIEVELDAYYFEPTVVKGR